MGSKKEYGCGGFFVVSSSLLKAVGSVSSIIVVLVEVIDTASDLKSSERGETLTGVFSIESGSVVSISSFDYWEIMNAVAGPKAIACRFLYCLADFQGLLLMLDIYRVCD